MAEDTKSLEMRLKRLEDTLGKMTEAAKVADVSAEEMKAYLKVRSVMEVDFCGINDCMPCVRCYRCIPVRCVRCIPTRCINECVCGPCGGFSGGLGGFTELGG